VQSIRKSFLSSSLLSFPFFSDTIIQICVCFALKQKQFRIYDQNGR
jgi:hypothetical protein